MDQRVLLADPDPDAVATTGRTLQRVLVDRATELRPLYWRAGRHERDGSGPFSAILQADGSVAIGAGTTLSFDSYFGGFFEPYWRLNTRLGTLVLSVSVSGPCIVRLRRRSIGVDRLLAEQEVGDRQRQQMRHYEIDASRLKRCMNIPARYCTGYLSDIGVPPVEDPMDFSGWLDIYLGGNWYTFDARHNRPRIGRILMARGRDATDVAISTAFGSAWLAGFEVVTYEQQG